MAAMTVRQGGTIPTNGACVWTTTRKQKSQEDLISHLTWLIDRERTDYQAELPRVSLCDLPGSMVESRPTEWERFYSDWAEMPSLSRMDQVRDTSGKAAVTELQLIIRSQAQFLPEKSQGKDLQKEWRALMLGIVIRTKRPVNMNIVALLTYKTNADEICNPASTIPLNTHHPAEKSLCSLVRCKNHTNGRNHIKIWIL